MRRWRFPVVMLGVPAYAVALLSLGQYMFSLEVRVAPGIAAAMNAPLSYAADPAFRTFPAVVPVVAATPSGPQVAAVSPTAAQATPHLPASALPLAPPASKPAIVGAVSAAATLVARGAAELTKHDRSDEDGGREKASQPPAATSRPSTVAAARSEDANKDGSHKALLPTSTPRPAPPPDHEEE